MADEKKTEAAKPVGKRQVVVAELRSGLKVNVGYYTSIEDVDKDAGKTGASLHLVNVYMQQKSALPDANAFVAEVIQALEPKFPLDSTKQKKVKKTKDGVETEEIVDTETEGELTSRFVAFVDAGKVTYPGITKGQALAWLQAKLDEHGVFNLDASAPVRTSKPKVPAKYALAAADQVFDDKPGESAVQRQKFIKHWEAKINKQLKELGSPHVFKPTGDKAADKLAFAWSIMAREEAERAKKAATEFNIDDIK